MSLFSFAWGDRIQALTQAISDQLSSREVKIQPQEEEQYDLSVIEFSEPLDLGLMEYHYQVLGILNNFRMEYEDFDTTRMEPNPVLVFQKSINELKMKVIENFLNDVMSGKEALKSDGTQKEELTWENRIERITEYGYERGVCLSEKEIDDVWEQLFSA